MSEFQDFIGSFKDITNNPLFDVTGDFLLSSLPVIGLIIGLINQIYSFIEDMEFKELLEKTNTILNQYLEKLIFIRYVYSEIPEEVFNYYINDDLFKINEDILESSKKLLLFCYSLLPENRDIWTKFGFIFLQDTIKDKIVDELTLITSLMLSFIVKNDDIFDKLSTVGHNNFILDMNKIWSSQIANKYFSVLKLEPSDIKNIDQLLEKLKKHRKKIVIGVIGLVLDEIEEEKKEQDNVDKAIEKLEVIQGDASFTLEEAPVSSKGGKRKTRQIRKKKLVKKTRQSKKNKKNIKK